MRRCLSSRAAKRVCLSQLRRGRTGIGQAERCERPHHSGDDNSSHSGVDPDTRLTPISQAGRFPWLLETTMENITDGSKTECRYQRPDREVCGGGGQTVLIM